MLGLVAWPQKGHSTVGAPFPPPAPGPSLAMNFGKDQSGQVMERGAHGKKQWEQERVGDRLAPAALNFSTGLPWGGNG